VLCSKKGIATAKKAENANLRRRRNPSTTGLRKHSVRSSDCAAKRSQSHIKGKEPRPMDLSATEYDEHNSENAIVAA